LNRFGLSMMAAVLAVIILALLSIAYGSTPIPMTEVVAAIGNALGLGPPLPDGPVGRIIVDLRVPRVLLTICIGVGLGVVGMLLQTVTRNDLADPFLFGLSAGAAAGAVTVITVTGDAFGIWTLPVAAFTGGMLATATVLMLQRRGEAHGPERLILAGLAVSFLFIALTNYLVFSGDQRAAHSVLFWTMGGLGLARWDNLPLGFLGAGIAVSFALANHRRLDALLAGEHTAESLGVRVARLRVLAFVAASLATALFVAVAGVIGFVGLMVPHIARSLAGPMHLRLSLACAALGACLLLASDLAARMLLQAQELPISIVTNSLGAIFVVALLFRRKAS
jgi:iron complex transport system permease protein